jgi:Na+-transporting methylmalonyl-CoA/oxaloacetate decarboxylase gamma subunit
MVAFLNCWRTTMKVLWTLVKVAVALVLVIPLSLLLLGVFGTVLGLAIMLLRLALLALLAVGAFKLIARVMRGPAPRVEPRATPRLTPADPYYQAAMRELDVDLPEARVRR